MLDRDAIHRRMQEHYERVWQAGNAWDFEDSPYENRRYAHLLEQVRDRHYERALEIGCGSGCFTRRLAEVAERVVAIDIAPSAIARAREQTGELGSRVELRVVNALEFDPEADGPWDLVVFSETIYSLGWLYPMFDVAWLARRLFLATRDGGRLLLTNTVGQPDRDWLMQPWLLLTYRDLFRNVGYAIEREGAFHDTKDGVAFEVLVAVFEKPKPR
jgi:SAM-dependent methyltransferase